MSRLRLRFLWWSLALAPFDWAARRFVSAAGAGKTRVLVVRVDALGDFILWLEGAHELRRFYPPDRFHLTLIGNRLWTPLARSLGCFDEIWEIDRRKFVRNPIYRFRILRRVASGGFASVVHPVSSRDFLWGDAIVHASRARERIGVSGNMDLLIPASRRISDRWYTRLIDSDALPRAQLPQNAAITSALTGGDCAAQVPKLDPAEPLPSELAAHDYYVISPGASNAIKQWPPEHFAEIASRIFARTGWIGVICGSRGEAELASRIRAATDSPLRDYMGQTSIAGLTGIISCARILVGNDSGAVHLAAALGTPSVCIAGGGHYGRFVPYQTDRSDNTAEPLVIANPMPCFGCNWRCTYKRAAHEPAACVREVSVETVWERTRPLLERRSAARDYSASGGISA
jgi:ADP-heptose:LPS heptosyltransferase